MNKIFIILVFILLSSVPFLGSTEPEYSECIEAAQKGDRIAQYQVGKANYNGTGTSQSYVNAVFWFRKSAENGYAPGELCLANCLFEGKGTVVDYKEAVKWYQKAAELGLDEALYKLGYCYEHAKGVDRNYRTARDCYQKAAQKGNKKAIEILQSNKFTHISNASGTASSSSQQKATSKSSNQQLPKTSNIAIQTHNQPVQSKKTRKKGDNYFLKLFDKLPGGISFKDRKTVISDLDTAWQQAYSTFFRKKKKYEECEKTKKETAQKIKNKKNEIRQNKERISTLQTISRGEFEERSVFENRKKQAENEIFSLTQRNTNLSREIKELEQLQNTLSLSLPRMTFSYSKTMAGTIKLSKSNFTLGTFDIDRRCFPCAIKEGRYHHVREKVNGKLYEISVGFSTEKMSLCFNSTAEARKFKTEYDNGEVYVYPCSISLTARQSWDKVMDAPEKEETDWVNVGTDIVKILGILTVGTIVNSLAPSDSSPDLNWLTDSVPLSDSSKKKVPAVYNEYDSYYISISINLLREYSF